MIRIGLAGWGDHGSVYPPGTRPQDKLREYARRFPVVEVDSTFYALQTPERFEAWMRETPNGFGFVVKAYQGMTGHQRGQSVKGTLDQWFETFRTSVEPVREAGKLAAVLFQFPPWFDCTSENVRVLRDTRKRMAGWACALEFRHQSWYVPGMREKTLTYMKQDDWIHSICDEPQAGSGSVPTVLEATDPELTIVRMHGRNTAGWQSAGAPNWREVRYLYDYSGEELAEWSDRLRELQQHSKEIRVIFNNNSGEHAAGNALELMRLLGQPLPEMPVPQPLPEQLDLFGGTTER